MKIDLKDFVSLLPRLQDNIHQAIQLELQRIAPDILSTVHDKIGTGEGVQALAASTRAEREEMGFDPNSPLLQTGDLLNSYEAVLGEHQLTVGSTDPIAEYVEIGTQAIPPRPVLLPAVLENMDHFTRELGKTVVASLSGKKKEDQ